MRDDYWVAVTRMRLAVADLLEELSPPEWEQRSLCAGWREPVSYTHLTLPTNREV